MPDATDDEDGAENSKNNTETNVKEVEPGVDVEEAAAIVNLVVHLLRKVFSSNIICAGLVLNFRFFFLLSYSRLVGNICIGHDITIGFN